MLNYKKYIEDLKISLDDIELKKESINIISETLIECFKNCYIRFNHSNININNLFTRRIISPEDNIYYHHKIFIKDNFENDICSICLDEFINDEDIENKDEIIGLKCNHMFHKKCVEPWIITKKSCPLCKVEV